LQRAAQVVPQVLDLLTLEIRRFHLSSLRSETSIQRRLFCREEGLSQVHPVVVSEEAEAWADRCLLPTAGDKMRPVLAPQPQIKILRIFSLVVALVLAVAVHPDQ